MVPWTFESFNAEGCALTVPPDAIVIGSYCQAGLSIAPVTPLTVAEQLENETVPKSASGSTPPANGGSTIHSADSRDAFIFVYLGGTVYATPFVRFVMLRMNRFPPA